MHIFSMLNHIFFHSHVLFVCFLFLWLYAIWYFVIYAITCIYTLYHYTSQRGCAFEPRRGEVYSMQHYVIKCVSDLRQVGGILRVLRFPPPIKAIISQIIRVVKMLHFDSTDSSKLSISFDFSTEYEKYLTKSPTVRSTNTYTSRCIKHTYRLDAST